MCRERLYLVLDFMYYIKYNLVRWREGAYMAKMGRPRVEEAKDRAITMRVTPAEYKKIKECWFVLKGWNRPCFFGLMEYL